jgi:sugar O-acyltransferase (sialic acid O-acetyltransferase NeuD family)
MKKIILLGHSDGGIPIVMDLVSEQYGCREFDIVKNMDLPNCRIHAELYQARFIDQKEYDFAGNLALPVQFGVHNSPATSILFAYFQNNHGIEADRYINLVHPKAYVASSASLSKGIMIEPMAVISSLAKLGFGVTVKRSASVGHHSDLRDFVTVNPGATLSGFVEVGEGTVIGSGAVVSNNIKIGKRCLIGAGSVVTKDIPDGVIAFGSPCKPVRENDAW